MRYLKILIPLFFCLFLFSCSDDFSSEKSSKERPHSPFVFRSVLDKNPRMITFALSDELWVAYRIANCGLYKAWKGNVNFVGTVYNTEHGPQPTTIGNAYMENTIDKVWTLKDANGTNLNATVEYKGHRMVGDGAELMFEMSAPGLEKAILIYEQPEASISESKQPVFERSFTTQNVPDGYTVHFTFNTNSIILESNIKTDGELTVNSKKENLIDKRTIMELNGTLALNSNGNTFFNTTFIATPVIINPLNMGTEEEEDSQNNLHPGARLIAKNDCKTCHNKNVKTIGPAYVSVAQKYKTTDENITMLANKIKVGGTGVWGNQIMNAHPDLSDGHLKNMVEYILSLDAEQEARENVAPEVEKKVAQHAPLADVKEEDLIPGLVTAVYPWNNLGDKIPNVGNRSPKYAGVMPNFDNVRDNDFKGLRDNFVIIADGYLDIDKSQNYAFRTWSDDGSILYLNDQKLIDNDGMHGVEYKEAMVYLEEGIYKLRLEFMQGGGGKFLSLNWKPEDYDAWAVVEQGALLHSHDQQKIIGDKILPMANVTKIPGDRSPLVDVHPSFTLFQARSEDFTPKVGGIDFLSDGRMLVSTWDAAGSVYIVENHKSENPDEIIHKLFAQGLAEPLGLKVVNDRIFIMQKQEMTELIDNDGDDVADEYRTLCDDWTVSANFHEFGFGLEGKDGYLYATLATAIEPGGASTNPQLPDRGKVLKVNIETGEREFVAHGLRTPNGIGIGYRGDIYVADNQGDWLPSSKIVHIQKDAWFGSRSVDFEGTEGMTETPPVVWLPQDEIGNSPSTPLSINVGPYKNQMIHGEVTHGGVKRVFVEEVEGQRQGALFRFIQGLEAGVNRLRWSPDGDLYVGGIGSSGNWGQNKKLWYGLQRLSYNGNTAFEMLAVRAKSNGMEIEFTEALEPGDGWQTDSYEVMQWYYLPTIEYGGPKMDNRKLNVRSATVSEDRKKVFLEIDGIKEGHVVYLRLKDKFISSSGNSLWSPECWYTMNKIPKNNNGEVKSAPFTIANNTLTPVEEEQGWKLLFDGKNISEFRNFKKQTIGSAWVVDDESIHLNAKRKPDGGWQAVDGGDIITDKAYENFDFKLEWKISNCGNSGIIFNVVEEEKYDHVWETGPEMQVLDNTCHPDTRFVTHRAGDLYDMIETKYITVNPAGEWNKIRIISKDGNVQFFQNGYEVVNFQMHNDKWLEMIKNSKFVEMPGFGLAKKGHIALQDHGDKVWFRNIKVREL
ncbi:MAG: family 16 glycoside hydrolase [Bacteroidota bacterium]